MWLDIHGVQLSSTPSEVINTVRTCWGRWGKMEGDEEERERETERGSEVELKEELRK